MITQRCMVQLHLLETLIRVQRRECNLFNRMATTCMLVIHHCQPLLLWLAVRLCTQNRVPVAVSAVVAAFAVLSGLYVWSMLHHDRPRCTRVTERSQPFVEWVWRNEAHAPVYHVAMAG